jgi:tetratricopeptide (TPR) repeat protein
LRLEAQGFARLLDPAGSERVTQKLFDVAIAEMGRAVTIFEGALGPEHLETLQARVNLGNAIRVSGDNVTARNKLRDAVESLNRIGAGAEDRIWATTVLALAVEDQEAIEMLRALARDPELPRVPPVIASQLNLSLATRLRAMGRHREAAIHGRRARELANDAASDGRYEWEELRGALEEYAGRDPD